MEMQSFSHLKSLLIVRGLGMEVFGGAGIMHDAPHGEIPSRLQYVLALRRYESNSAVKNRASLCERSGHGVLVA